MILFLHGFASCGQGNKSQQLSDWFGREQLLAPDLPADPASAIALAADIIATQPVELLVGSSLGGYYATWLARRYELPAVLINPSVRPFETLAPLVGTQRWWCRDEEFDWTTEHLEALRQFQVDEPGNRFLLLLQSGDEVLDHREAVARYADSRMVVEQGGNHRFENLADYRSMIERFLLQERNGPGELGR